MEAALRKFVRARAGDQCEYCRLHQSAAPFFTFHVEHIIAQQHISDDSVENLALACPDCNRHKGPNLTTVDPQTHAIVRLFNPRRDLWAEHFQFQGATIVGLSDVGTATVRLLDMNQDERIEMRTELLRDGLL